MSGIITGKEIMDRWGITAFQLQDVLREGELVAVQDDLIARRTPKSDPCLFCDGQRERETGVTYPARFPWVVVLCEHAPERDVHQLSRCLPPEIYQERLTDFPDAPDMVAKPRCAKRWTEEQRGWRIEAAKFLLFELKAYEKENGLQELDAATQEEAARAPHFATPSELVQYHRGRGVHESHELARLVDEEFTGTAKLTDEALGRLLPATPGAEVSDEAHKRRGHRLRKKYQQS